VSAAPAQSPSNSASARARRLQRIERLLGEPGFPEGLNAQLTRARERIRRDLLPRAEGASSCVVIGLVGPNNAGKSSLFAGLVGESLSPVSPTGGFTRVLVGAARPDTIATSSAELERRFDVRRLGQRGATEAEVHDSADPSRLLLSDAASLPENLVLIDAPDFDSVFTENRDAGEALLLTADLLVAVLTPHTYQNLGVVEFFRLALSSGRPYCLVYNEGADEQVALRHLGKFAADIGREPSAMFFAPHDRSVQTGEVLPNPLRIDDPSQQSLAQWLFAEGRAQEAREASWAASVTALGQDLDQLLTQWASSVEGPRLLHEALRAQVGVHAGLVTRSLFPLAPFRDALQAQLDERSLFHSSLRFVPALVGRTARQGFDALRSTLGGAATPLSSLDEYKASELRRLLGTESKRPSISSGPSGLAALWETVASEVHRHQGAVSASAVCSDFNAAARESLPSRLRSLHDQLPVPFDDFETECGSSIAKELEVRGEEGGLQWAYTALKVLPPVTAVTVMALTGVAGDIGAGVAYLATEPLLHRAVGKELVSRVHEAWWRRRTEELSGLLLRAIAPALSAELAGVLDRYEESSAVLAAARDDLKGMLV
jgi:hypothetical protein